jgi:hypothetical protein
VVAETGLFFIQPWWLPLAFFAGFFGFEALGPTQFILLGMVSIVLAGDPRETLMPFVVNGLKIAEENKVSRGRAGAGAMVAVTLALAVAIPSVLWMQYQFGKNKDGWAPGAVTTPFKEVTKNMQQAAATGSLEDILDNAEAGKLGTPELKYDFVWFAGAGLVLVLACSFMRLRFTWWPIHPVIFLVGLSYPLWNMHFSFLLGWLIKSAVTRVGGVQAYRAGRPLMLGVIAGDLLGGLAFNGAGIWVALTGGEAMKYAIFPG